MRQLFKFAASEYPASEPRFLSMSEQFSRFKYNINVGRNVGWADRVRYLLLSPAAVIMQDCPCMEYWQPLAKPYVHYVREFSLAVSRRTFRLTAWAAAHRSRSIRTWTI